jgi:hypothetical protein
VSVSQNLYWRTGRCERFLTTNPQVLLPGASVALGMASCCGFFHGSLASSAFIPSAHGAAEPRPRSGPSGCRRPNWRPDGAAIGADTAYQPTLGPLALGQVTLAPLALVLVTLARACLAWMQPMVSGHLPQDLGARIA